VKSSAAAGGLIFGITAAWRSSITAENQPGGGSAKQAAPAAAANSRASRAYKAASK